ncbi:MAG: galactokinase [Watsoniomyces obsoletus]|nr:MAG: galactokinase [Watsoniomyces obsoletus]
MSTRQRKAAAPSASNSSSTITQVSNAAHTLEEKVEHALLLLWDDLPDWQRDNHYIQSGYRRASNSFFTSLRSLTYLHNESVNIWTHLLGAITSVSAGVALFYVLAPRYETASHADVLAFSCFFVGAAGCLGMSATYHAISNHSPLVASLGNKLDYVGIVLLIWGSFVASIYYGFGSHPHLRMTYWTMISVLGLGCAAVSILPKFRTPSWRPYRAAMFVAMGLSAVFPVFHGWRLYGLGPMRHQIGLDWLVLQGALYILGAGIYAARVPERLYPGRFDIWGSSHQIFHMLVLAAAAAHLVGLLKAFDSYH